MNERIRHIRIKLCRIKKFSILKIVEQSPKFVFCQSANCTQECKRYMIPNDSCILQHVLGDSRKGINTRGEDRPHRGRDLGTREWPSKRVSAARAREYPSINELTHDFFDEERIAAGALHQKASYARQTTIAAKQGLEKFREPLGDKWVQA